MQNQAKSQKFVYKSPEQQIISIFFHYFTKIAVLNKKPKILNYGLPFLKEHTSYTQKQQQNSPVAPGSLRFCDSEASEVHQSHQNAIYWKQINAFLRCICRDFRKIILKNISASFFSVNFENSMAVMAYFWAFVAFSTLTFQD